MSNSTFQEIIQQDTPTLVDFSAEWCGPCKMMAPVLSQLKSEMGSTLRILKVDVDKNPQVAQAYRISGVPTLMLFKSGQTLWRDSGAMPLVQLKKVLQTYI